MINLISKEDAKLLAQLIENVLFENGYDIQHNEYLKSLYEIKIKMDLIINQTDSQEKQIEKKKRLEESFEEHKRKTMLNFKQHEKLRNRLIKGG